MSTILNSETNGEQLRNKTKLNWPIGSEENAKLKSTLKVCMIFKSRESMNIKDNL